MAERQQKLAAIVLKDPDVASLSSFIGVDGQNVTLNSGRFLINLKPHEQRTARAPEIIERIKAATTGTAGIRLYLQSVQDLTIDTAVSATQYQVILENPNLTEFETWVPRFVQALQGSPLLMDVASDLQASGLAAYITIDRPTAGRYGITPATVDNALYDAFGQRIISTIFTQSNQYRVILEADPDLHKTSRAWTTSTAVLDGRLGAGAALGGGPCQRAPGAPPHQPSRQFPATTVSFNSRRGRRWATRSRR